MSTPHAGPTAPELARAAGMTALDYMRHRGYVYDVSDEAGLQEALRSGPVTGYVGFDPTAPSLHAGHLMGIMMLAVLQRFGHRPIALGGGGTALVGDPSGKTATRAVISEQAIRDNLVSILPQFGRYIDFDGGRFGDNPPALLVNNADWLLELRYIPFLRDVGRHFSVNEMLAAETYKVRIEGSGLNFVEFNYRIVQAYDFLHLFREVGCTLQMGGSDQWGNIVAGVDLIRKADAGHAFALVCPLLTTASGKKMGKTEGNSLWLDANLTAPYEFFQYWVNVEDADVERLLRLYTFLPDDRIADLMSVSGAALRETKQELAWQITALSHGPQAADEARQAARALFGGAAPTADDPSIPTTVISAAEAEGISIADLFIRAGLAPSRREARTQAANGALWIGEERVADADAVWDGRAPALLRFGKKKYQRIRVE